MVNAERIVAAVSPDSAPVKRLVQTSRERGLVVDACYGRAAKTVLVADSGHLILSSLPSDRLQARINEEVNAEQ